MIFGSFDDIKPGTHVSIVRDRDNAEVVGVVLGPATKEEYLEWCKENGDTDEREIPDDARFYRASVD